jgi:hypothetical protein
VNAAASITCPATYLMPTRWGLARSWSPVCTDNGGWADWDVVPRPCAQLCNTTGTPTCQRYPPVPLAQSGAPQLVSGQAHGNGHYTATASSVIRNEAWHQAHAAFDQLTMINPTTWTFGWENAATQAINLPRTFLDPFRFYDGHWIQLQLPQPIYLHQYSVVSRPFSDIMNNWVVLGSTDGQAWQLLDENMDRFRFTQEGVGGECI